MLKSALPSWKSPIRPLIEAPIFSAPAANRGALMPAIALVRPVGQKAFFQANLR